MFAYNFSTAHSAYVYYFLHYVRSLSPGHFSPLSLCVHCVVLRVRHFRIASVIILIRMVSAQKAFGVSKREKLIFSSGCD